MCLSYWFLDLNEISKKFQLYPLYPTPSFYIHVLKTEILAQRYEEQYFVLILEAAWTF